MVFNVYNDEEIAADKTKGKVTLESFVIGQNAPTVVICPGGAYVRIADWVEGRPYAHELNKRGYNAFVLKYRVGNKAARYPNPLKDLARAISLIKSMQSEMKINAEKIALVGSSAGGHLCGLFCAEYKKFEKICGCGCSLKPDALVLAYPVVTMGKYTHHKSKYRLLGFGASKKMTDEKSVEKAATEDFPPTFVWHDRDDWVVNYRNSLMLKAALDKKGVDCEIHIYKFGSHGIGLAKDLPAEGWMEKAANFLDKYLQ